MTYRVEVVRKAAKFLASLRDTALRRRLLEVLRELETSPRPPGCVKLTGSSDVFRIRVGDHRIVYQVQDKVLLVLVIDIGHRREIYR
ncbi:MAG: type II toxin-antitoxin system RelE/ParE family toxin [Chthoniobacterales bacterium]|nr:type II toxin-antitoxin system RelE/ParE family toxin [Chthoniobacterales bacterium]